MSIVLAAATRVRAEVASAVRQPTPDADGQPVGLFDPRLRRAAIVWIFVSLPVVTAIAAVAATTPERYLVVFAVAASGAYTTPALFYTYLAARRAPRPDNLCWWLWLVAVVLMYGIGCAMLYGVATGVAVPAYVSAVAVAITGLLVMTVVVLGGPHAVGLAGRHRRPARERHVGHHGGRAHGPHLGRRGAPGRRRLVRRAGRAGGPRHGVRRVLGGAAVPPTARGSGCAMAAGWRTGSSRSCWRAWGW